jgi:hypothetical protein
MVTFAVMLPACVHVADKTRLIATYSEEYSLADVFREIHKLACLGQFSTDRKNLFLFSRRRPGKRGLGWETHVTFSQITGERRFKKKKKK